MRVIDDVRFYSHEAYVQKQIIIWRNVFTSFHGETILLGKKSIKKALARSWFDRSKLSSVNGETGQSCGGKLERIPIRDSRECREDNNVRGVRFVPAADLLFYPVKRCHPGPGKNLPVPLRRKGQRRLIYCFARVTLVFITKWINRSVPRCYDIRRATFDQRRDALVDSCSSIDPSIFYRNSFCRNGTHDDDLPIDFSSISTSSSLKRYYFTNLIIDRIPIIDRNVNVKLVNCYSSNLKGLFRKTIQSR